MLSLFRERCRKLSACVVYSVLLTSCAFVASAAGRETSVSAGLTMRQEYDSNFYRTRNNPEEAWISTVRPNFTLSSRGQYDGLSLLYDPGYSRNLTTDTYDINHHALLSFYQNLSSQFKIMASDVFSRSKDPENSKEAGVDLTDKRGWQKYWVNTARLEGGYAYQQNCLLTMAYANNRFVDEDLDSNTYERHMPSISLAHQFSPFWQSNVAYAYTHGDFKKTADSAIHAPSLTINFMPNKTSRIFGSYSYSKTEYDGAIEGYLTQNGMLGFSYAFDPNTSSSFSVGKYYVARQAGADNDGYSYDINLTKKFQKGNLAFAGNGGMEDRQFNAAGEGLTKFWTVQGSGSYQFAEQWSTGANGFFRRNNFVDRTLSAKEDSYGGSLNITCSFGRWYKASLRYSFNELNAELDAKDYQDHRLSLDFTAAGELWRW